MGEKTYNSVSYFAQEFRKCLSDAKIMGQLELGAVSTEIRGRFGETVSFEIAGINSRVTFVQKEGAQYISHELTIRNKWENEMTRTITREMKIKRSKTERISGAYYPKIIEEFILPNIRRAYKSFNPFFDKSA